jgi:CheY-like chemotaxis protein
MRATKRKPPQVIAPAPRRLRGHARDVVAIFNTSPDTVSLLRDVLEHAGMLVVSGYTFDIRDGRIDLQAFLRTHQPKVILYDIAPPYERNWQLLEHLRRTVLADYRFVITSTNPSRVEPLVGRDQQVYEVVDKGGDLDVIVRATREALRARATRIA